MSNAEYKEDGDQPSLERKLLTTIHDYDDIPNIDYNHEDGYTSDKKLELDDLNPFKESVP